MMPTLYPPNRLDHHPRSIFLAGSIEMGKARDWQQEIIDVVPTDVWVFNPRRPQWDSSWEQSISNPIFAEQVNWELDHLETASLAVFYFQPNTMSPITLMELTHRLATQNDTQRILVCCPDGFWRKGNIEVVCARYNIELLHNWEDLVKSVDQWVD